MSFKSVRSAAEKLQAELGQSGLDVLCNNAGIVFWTFNHPGSNSSQQNNGKPGGSKLCAKQPQIRCLTTSRSPINGRGPRIGAEFFQCVGQKAPYILHTP